MPIFCECRRLLSLYSLHVLNRDVSMIQSINLFVRSCKHIDKRLISGVQPNILEEWQFYKQNWHFSGENYCLKNKTYTILHIIGQKLFLCKRSKCLFRQIFCLHPVDNKWPLYSSWNIKMSVKRLFVSKEFFVETAAV